MTVDEGRRVTIDKIARAAGVSVSTVSSVLDGGTDVAPRTRERVAELLSRYGYPPRAGGPDRARA